MLFFTLTFLSLFILILNNAFLSEAARGKSRKTSDSHNPMNCPENDYYCVLNIGNPSSTSVDEIKKQYRSLAKIYHPDKQKSSNSEEAFIRISKAYETLSDESNRREYDLQRRMGFNRPGSGSNDAFFQQQQQRQQGNGFRRHPAYTHVDRDFDESFDIDIDDLLFSTFAGRRFHGQQRQQQGHFFRGPDGNVYYTTSAGNPFDNSFHYNFQSNGSWWDFGRAILFLLYPFMNWILLLPLLCCLCCPFGDENRRQEQQRRRHEEFRQRRQRDENPSPRPNSSRQRPQQPAGKLAEDENDDVVYVEEEMEEEVEEDKSKKTKQTSKKSASLPIPLETLSENELSAAKKGFIIVVGLNREAEDVLESVRSRFVTDPLLFYKYSLAGNAHSVATLERVFASSQQSNSVHIVALCRQGTRWTSFPSDIKIGSQEIETWLLRLVEGAIAWKTVV